MKKLILPKRIISLLTALILVFVAIPVAFATQDDNGIITRGELAKFIMEVFDVKYKSSMENHFSDISKQDEYYKAVIALVYAEIMAGYTDGTFKPENTVRKVELAAFFSNSYSYNKYGSYSKMRFAPTDEVTDLAKTHWAYSLIGFAIDEGIMPLDDGMFYPDKEARWSDIDYSVLSELLGKKIESPCPIEEPDEQISSERTIDVKQKGLFNFIEVRQYVADSFTDVKSTDWFSSFVAKAYNLNLMSGSSATTFNANGNVTIAETITMAAKIHKIYNTGSADGFTATSPWYQTYVDYAIENGIAFAGQNYTRPATRSEFVVILGRSMPSDAFKKISDISDDAIPDVPMTLSGADSIYKFYRAGIIAGSDKYGTFNPNSNIKRSEVATIVTKLVKENERKMTALEKKPIVEGLSDNELSELIKQFGNFAHSCTLFYLDCAVAIENSYIAKNEFGGYDNYVHSKTSMVNAITELDKVMELCGNASGARILKENCAKYVPFLLNVAQQPLTKTRDSLKAYRDILADYSGLEYFEKSIVPIIVAWHDSLNNTSTTIPSYKNTSILHFFGAIESMCSD